MVSWKKVASLLPLGCNLYSSSENKRLAEVGGSNVQAKGTSFVWLGIRLRVTLNRQFKALFSHFESSGICTKKRRWKCLQFVTSYYSAQNHVVMRNSKYISVKFVYVNYIVNNALPFSNEVDLSEKKWREIKGCLLCYLLEMNTHS